MQSAAVFSIEAPWQARSTLALVHGQGFRHLLFLEAWSEGCCHQPQGNNQIHRTSQRFLAGEDSILLKISLSVSRISSKGLLILWGHCSEHINFNSLRHLTLCMVNG